jgi:hypothetical protein
MTPFAGVGDCLCPFWLSALMARCEAMANAGDELDRKLRAAADDFVICVFAVAERDEAEPRDVLEEAFDHALTRAAESGDIVRRWASE